MRWGLWGGVPVNPRVVPLGFARGVVGPPSWGGSGLPWGVTGRWSSGDEIPLDRSSFGTTR